MNNIAIIVLYSFFSGITVLIGALLARTFERLAVSKVKEEFVHATIAFGGGVLMAAVAFVLTPLAIDTLSLALIGVIFLSGGLSFFLIDMLIAKKGGSIAQLMAMLMDFVPEAIALGATFAHNRQLGLLLAIFIGLQNLPESFNAYRDLRSTGYSPNRCIQLFAPLSLVGIFSALLGSYFLSDKPLIVTSLMLFASGGIVYLVFQDIAPMSKIKNNWLPALGGTLGFFIGIIGKKICG